MISKSHLRVVGIMVPKSVSRRGLRKGESADAAKEPLSLVCKMVSSASASACKGDIVDGVQIPNVQRNPFLRPPLRMSVGGIRFITVHKCIKLWRCCCRRALIQSVQDTDINSLSKRTHNRQLEELASCSQTACLYGPSSEDRLVAAF